MTFTLTLTLTHINTHMQLNIIKKKKKYFLFYYRSELVSIKIRQAVRNYVTEVSQIAILQEYLEINLHKSVIIF